MKRSGSAPTQQEDGDDGSKGASSPEPPVSYAYDWAKVSSDTQLVERLKKLWAGQVLPWEMRAQLAEWLVPDESGAHPFQPDMEDGSVSPDTAKRTIEELYQVLIDSAGEKKALKGVIESWYKSAKRDTMAHFGEIAKLIEKEKDAVRTFRPAAAATSPPTAVATSSSSASTDALPAAPAAPVVKPAPTTGRRPVVNPLLADSPMTERAADQQQHQAAAAKRARFDVPSPSVGKSQRRPVVNPLLVDQDASSGAGHSSASKSAKDKPHVEDQAIDYNFDPAYTVSPVGNGAKVYSFTEVTSVSGMTFEELLIGPS